MGNYVNRTKKKKKIEEPKKETPARKIIDKLKKEEDEIKKARWKAFQKDAKFKV